MKFQKQLTQEKNTSWNEPNNDYYLDYKSLKKCIKAITNGFVKAQTRRGSIGKIRSPSEGNNIAEKAVESSEKITPIKGDEVKESKRFEKLRKFGSHLKNKRRIAFTTTLRKEVIKIENFIRSRLANIRDMVETHKEIIKKLSERQMNDSGDALEEDIKAEKKKLNNLSKRILLVEAFIQINLTGYGPHLALYMGFLYNRNFCIQHIQDSQEI